MDEDSASEDVRRAEAYERIFTQSRFDMSTFLRALSDNYEVIRADAVDWAIDERANLNVNAIIPMLMNESSYLVRGRLRLLAACQSELALTEAISAAAWPICEPYDLAWECAARYVTSLGRLYLAKLIILFVEGDRHVSPTCAELIGRITHPQHANWVSDFLREAAQVGEPYGLSRLSRVIATLEGGVEGHDR